ncbi:MAG: hypothetical protein IKR23_10475 [Lachnospiraceae bacterium]|nr:hypothetical protein [Lachnospiraceae bacterium]
MNPELYKKAYEAKKSGLWDVFMEEQVFALKVPDADTVFVQVTRSGTDEKMLAVYYGEQVLDLVRRFYDMESESMADADEANHLEASFEGVELTFTLKDRLPKREAKEASGVARECGIRLGGSGAYPLFRRLCCGHSGEELSLEEDEKIMQLAIDAAMWLAKDGSAKFRLFIPSLTNSAYDMPLLEYNKGKYKRSRIHIEALGEMKYPAGSNCNEILQKKIKKMPKKGEWACRLVRLRNTVNLGLGRENVLPSKLKTYDYGKDRYVDVASVVFYEEHTDAVLDAFMEAITEYGRCPVRINVMDMRTFVLLKRWCKNCGISLRLHEYIPILDVPDSIYMGDPEGEGMTEFGPEYFDVVLECLLSAPEEQLKSFAYELKEIRAVKDSGVFELFPPSLRKKMEKLIKKLDKLGL